MDGRGLEEDSYHHLRALASRYQGSMALSLRDAVQVLDQHNLTRRGVIVDDGLLHRLASGQKLQPYLTTRLALATRQFSEQAFLTHRWRRWFAGDDLALAVRGASRARKVLASIVPPCVLHALLISWLNGWCTSRRFQCDIGPCRLCRDCNGRDDLEHYLRCPFAWAAAPRLALLGPAPSSLASALLLDDIDHDLFAPQATMIFALYGAFNLARSQDVRLARGELRMVLLERFRTAMQRWPRLSRLLRDRCRPR